MKHLFFGKPPLKRFIHFYVLKAGVALNKSHEPWKGRSVAICFIASVAELNNLWFVGTHTVLNPYVVSNDSQYPLTQTLHCKIIMRLIRGT